MSFICEECNQRNISYKWCRLCDAKWFQQNFKNWTSGNDGKMTIRHGTLLN